MNFSSVGARLGGLPGLVAYATSKAAVENFTVGFAKEVGPEGIRVNAIAPGMIETDMTAGPLRDDGFRKHIEEMTPLRRVGTPDEVAEAVAWLMSPAAVRQWQHRHGIRRDLSTRRCGVRPERNACPHLRNIDVKAFLTGATGYVGSVIAEKLIAQRHILVGLARSESAASILRNLGIQPVSGNLDEPDGLTEIGAASDAVVHLAFQWGASVTATLQAERRVVEALLAGEAGTDKSFIFPGGTSVLGDTDSRVFDESTPITPHALDERLQTEKLVLEAMDCHGIVIRAPNVYGRGDGCVSAWKRAPVSGVIGVQSGPP